MQSHLSTTVTQTMSSVELVKIINDMRETGKPEIRHIDFMTKIEKICRETGLGFISHTYQHQQNKQFYPCALLCARLSKLMVMTESVKVQLAVLDRVTELETAQPKLPTNYLEALTALVQSETEKQSLQHQIEVDKPKVEFAMAIRNTDGKVSIGDFAKAIGTGQNRLFERLRNDGFLMASNKPYQHSIDRGLMSIIEQKPHVDSKGVSHPSFKTLITGKGQVYFEKRYRNNVASHPRLQLVQS